MLGCCWCWCYPWLKCCLWRFHCLKELAFEVELSRPANTRSADAADVSLDATSATSVSVITSTETVGVTSSLAVAATCVSIEISAVPNLQACRLSNIDETSPIEVLPSSVGVSVSSHVVMLRSIKSSNCSPTLIASSPNVVGSLSSVRAYIEMPVNALDTTATADERQQHEFCFSFLE